MIPLTLGHRDKWQVWINFENHAVERTFNWFQLPFSQKFHFPLCDNIQIFLFLSDSKFTTKNLHIEIKCDSVDVDISILLGIDVMDEHVFLMTGTVKNLYIKNIVVKKREPSLFTILNNKSATDKCKSLSMWIWVHLIIYCILVRCLRYTLLEKHIKILSPNIRTAFLFSTKSSLGQVTQGMLEIVKNILARQYPSQRIQNGSKLFQVPFGALNVVLYNQIFSGCNLFR